MSLVQLDHCPPKMLDFGQNIVITLEFLDFSMLIFGLFNVGFLDFSMGPLTFLDFSIAFTLNFLDFSMLIFWTSFGQR